jgi:antitoxin component of MazEF toxin-antitoxin module
MPLIRKITPSGDSRGITLPKSWLEDHERRAGHKIESVAVEVNDDLIVRPYLDHRE